MKNGRNCLSFFKLVQICPPSLCFEILNQWDETRFNSRNHIDSNIPVQYTWLETLHWPSMLRKANFC